MLNKASFRLRRTQRELTIGVYSFQRRNYEQEFQFSHKNFKAFLDIEINSQPKGRIVFEVFAKYLPRTSLNFQSLCTGTNGVSYRGSSFHRVVPGFMVQGGAVTVDGKAFSIYGSSFRHENYLFSHDSPGMLSMANDETQGNNSQFFITTSDAAW